MNWTTINKEQDSSSRVSKTPALTSLNQGGHEILGHETDLWVGVVSEGFTEEQGLEPALEEQMNEQLNSFIHPFNKQLENPCYVIGAKNKEVDKTNTDFGDTDADCRLIWVSQRQAGKNVQLSAQNLRECLRLARHTQGLLLRRCSSCYLSCC